MKLNKFFIKTLVLTVIMGTMNACSNFLDEELDTARNTDYFKTPQGVRELAVGIYYNLRFKFAYEWGYATTNYGTDEFRVAGDASNAPWNNYDATFAPLITAVNVNTAMTNTLWDNMYMGINSANLLIENATAYLPDGDEKNTILGEAHFVRAHNYQKLVRQYGGVPLKLKPSTTAEREFSRSTAEAITAQVIDDFEKAYDFLPATPSAVGKITKDAAAHFLAKAYLFRASEINDSWNSATKTTDLATGLQYAEEVISHRTLAPNYRDLWAYTGVNGANENLNEIILAAQFTSDVSTRGRYGNQTHLYFPSWYGNGRAQMARDLAGGREYQRLRSNYYAYEVYDKVNDSRFWKSFKTKYSVNNPSGSYVRGDLGAIYIINESTDTRFANTGDVAAFTDNVTGKVVPHVYPAYVGGQPYIDGDIPVALQPAYCGISKFLDGSRASVAETIGNRDGIIARLADTYLTAAEICIKQSNYTKALTFINDVRARAAYKAGENRAAYTDGGAMAAGGFYAGNSYYESNDIAVSTDATSLQVTDFNTLPAEDEAIITTLGYTSEYDRALCFLLNERSRELMGEFHRWEDLSRTLTLVARAKAFNKQASPNIKNHHVLRPIPQNHLDVIQKNGRALTPEEKQAEQNPGY